MKLSLRFVLPLMLVLAGFAYAVAPLVDRLTAQWFVRDLEIRASLIVNTIQEPLQEQLAAGKKAKIGEFFGRISQDERLYAIGYCATLRPQHWPAARCPPRFDVISSSVGKDPMITCCPARRAHCMWRYDHWSMKPATAAT